MARCLTFTTLLILLIHWPIDSSQAAVGDSPRTVVEIFQEQLLGVMKEARTLGVKGRFERLESPIEDSFHMPLMTQVVTGNFWKQATRAQRTSLVTAFRRMIMSTLATLFDDYSGQIFATQGEKDGPSGTRIVETRIVDPDKSFVDIAYVVKIFKNRWYIVDVLVDNGISELSTRRSEYHRLLSNQGVDGLVKALNAKANELIAP
jgi:phospholipid transport system substrate-binding protein